MLLGGLQKTTLLDFPGTLACIVFTRGCNFRCPYCYNTELIPVPSGEDNQEDMAELWNFLENRRNLLDGVTITGGEPLIWEDLPEHIRTMGSIGFKIKLDTNGSFPSRLEKLLEENLLDYVALDVKFAPSSYDKLAGLPGAGKKVEASLNLLKQGKIPYECRTTLVPRFHNTENLEELGQWIAQVPLWALQRFRPGKALDPTLKGEATFTSREMESFKKAAAPYAREILLRE